MDLLLDPGVLARIRDNELRAASGAAVVTIPDVFSTMTNAIWAEAGMGGSRPRNAGSIRRDLQRMYLAELTRMVVNPVLGTPDDARTLAQVTLANLGTQLSHALSSGGLDAYTRAHYADSRQRITQALNAQVVVPATQVR